MKHAAPARKRAWHVGRPTMPSIESAIASDGMLSDTDRWRWAPRLPFPTSFANSPKRTCDRRRYILRPEVRALRQTEAAANVALACRTGCRGVARCSAPGRGIRDHIA